MFFLLFYFKRNISKYGEGTCMPDRLWSLRMAYKEMYNVLVSGQRTCFYHHKNKQISGFMTSLDTLHRKCSLNNEQFVIHKVESRCELIFSSPLSKCFRHASREEQSAIKHSVYDDIKAKLLVKNTQNRLVTRGCNAFVIFNVDNTFWSTKWARFRAGRMENVR